MAKINIYKKRPVVHEDQDCDPQVSLRVIKDNELTLSSWSVSHSQFACILPKGAIIIHKQNDLPYSTPGVIPLLAIQLYFCAGPVVRKGDCITARRRMGVITPDRKVWVRIRKTHWMEFEEFNTLIDDKTLNREYKALIKRIFGGE